MYFHPTSFVSGATYSTGPVLTSFLIFRFCQKIRIQLSCFIVRIHLTGAITKWLSSSCKPTSAPKISAVLFNFQLVRFQVIPGQFLFEGKEEMASLKQTHIWSVLSGRGAFIPATSLTGFENLEQCSLESFRLL